MEFLALYFGAVGGYALIGSPGSPIPVLIVLGVGAFVYLRRVNRADLVRWEETRRVLPQMLIRWLIVAVAAIAVITIFFPERLFSLPRQEPLLWIAIAIFYPLVSVYPQELIFRGFLAHWYALAFGTGWGIVAASAAAFAFAHIIYGTVIAVALTLIGGWMFASRYRQTRSLLAASVEHAHYGVLAFTVGLGDLFYHGAS